TTLYRDKQHNRYAANPAKDTDAMLKVLSEMYDFIKADTIIEVTLNNGNPESHPGPSILHAGRIDYAGDSFYLYKEGITEHTVNIVHKIDEERQKICKVLYYEAVDKSARIERSGYFEEGHPLLEQFNGSLILKEILGPTDLQTRYISEDVESGLVLWSSIADAVGVDTPVMDSVITLTGVLLERDYFEIGLTLDKLGIDIKDAEELNKIMIG